MENVDEDLFVSLSQESGRSVRFVDSENNFGELETKVFNDPIHGHIELHPLLVKVIDTPQFQRLRNVKQLGANYFVYPGASHQRFEHCIGTCHLAGKLVRHLQKKQPYLDINETDVLCVEMAALIHDLGHGPFSHMFDMNFLPRMRNTIIEHEVTSCKMFDHLIEDNNLRQDFQSFDLGDQDIMFIKEMVYGPFEESTDNIVSNHRNKVDVDKWDYFARDCHHLGIKNSFDHERFIHFCRVLTVEGENPQICARDKEGLNLYEMFHTRTVLHRRAYQHRVNISIEKMICDAMCLADQHITYVGSTGQKLPISQTVDDPVAFTKLSDNVFYEILYSTSEHEDMKKARSILQRIQKRQLYCFVGHTKPGREYPLKGTYDETLLMEKEISSYDEGLCEEEVVVAIKNFSYGMKDKNPCDEFRFYSKSNPNKPYRIRREEVSEMLPLFFTDFEIQVFCKPPEKREKAKICFEKWCKNKKFVMPQIQNGLSDTLTPLKRKDTSGGVPPKRRALDL